MKLPQEIGFVSLWAQDFENQRSAFQDLFGCEVHYESDGVAVVGGPSGQVVLQRAAAGTAHLDGTTQIGFYVDDLEEWVAYLSARGADIVAPGTDVGGGNRMVLVRVPGGQLVALVG
ncbi:MAG: VOC family protein [Myxococcales bacterium]|nr:VOC family protein [Myxococcales bacterium]